MALIIDNKGRLLNYIKLVQMKIIEFDWTAFYTYWNGIFKNFTVYLDHNIFFKQSNKKNRRQITSALINLSNTVIPRQRVGHVFRFCFYISYTQYKAHIYIDYNIIIYIKKISLQQINIIKKKRKLYIYFILHFMLPVLESTLKEWWMTLQSVVSKIYYKVMMICVSLFITIFYMIFFLQTILKAVSCLD